MVSIETIQKYIKIQLVYVLQYLRDAAVFHAKIPERIITRLMATNILSITLKPLALLEVTKILARAKRMERLPQGRKSSTGYMPCGRMYSIKI